jgi:hypothetical protein
MNRRGYSDAEMVQALVLALEAQNRALLGNRFSLREFGLRAAALGVITGHALFEGKAPAEIARRLTVSHTALAQAVRRLRGEMQREAEQLPSRCADPNSQPISEEKRTETLSRRVLVKHHAVPNPNQGTRKRHRSRRG